jgi:hypothetical protein
MTGLYVHRFVIFGPQTRIFAGFSHFSNGLHTSAMSFEDATSIDSGSELVS